jgi:hypothetical protein
MTPELLGLLKVQDNHTMSAIGWPFWQWELLAHPYMLNSIYMLVVEQREREPGHPCHPMT